MLRRLLTLFVLVALLVPLGAARSVVLCRATQEVRTTCCCGHDEDETKHDGPAIKIDCCETKAIAVPTTNAAPSKSLAPFALASVFTEWAATDLRTFREAEGDAPRRARGPPRRASIFIENCSLLI